MLLCVWFDFHLLKQVLYASAFDAVCLSATLELSLVQGWNCFEDIDKFPQGLIALKKMSSSLAGCHLKSFCGLAFYLNV